MSCENIRDQLAHLELKLPEDSFDRLLVRSQAEILEKECIRLPSSYTATIGRTFASRDLSDDQIESIQTASHQKFIRTAQRLLARYDQPENRQGHY